MDKPEAEIKETDVNLKEALDKIEWAKYLDYGTIRIQVRDGKKTLVAVERTYIEF